MKYGLCLGAVCYQIIFSNISMSHDSLVFNIKYEGSEYTIILEYHQSRPISNYKIRVGLYLINSKFNE